MLAGQLQWWPATPADCRLEPQDEIIDLRVDRKKLVEAAGLVRLLDSAGLNFNLNFNLNLNQTPGAESQVCVAPDHQNAALKPMGQREAGDSGAKSAETSLKSAGHRLERLARRNRTVFSEWQLSELEWRFTRNKYLITSDRIRVAKLLNLNQLQVKTWFQVSLLQKRLAGSRPRINPCAAPSGGRSAQLATSASQTVQLDKSSWPSELGPACAASLPPPLPTAAYLASCWLVGWLAQF